MVNPTFYKASFDELAPDGFIGDANGKLAYAYMRVASYTQAENDWSRLSREIKHIHEAAYRHNLKIPWELVFADYGSGLDYQSRPSLNLLRSDYLLPQRRAHFVVMEIVYRLSRKVGHLNFLLDEMQDQAIKPVFWQPSMSEVEPTKLSTIVENYIAQNSKLRLKPPK